jgi:hypothetical protein
MKKLTQKELDAILESHEAWLRHKGGKKARLGRQDLSGLYFGHAYLDKIDLSGANLKTADLSWANLEGANLTMANLEGANLQRARLNNTNLTFAKLSGAKLVGATLCGANLHGADLSDADLSMAFLRTDRGEKATSLYNATLTNTDLTGANLQGVDLSWANLRGAKLSCALLDRADLSDAELDESEQIRRGIILKKPMIGYKKCRYNIIVTLRIPKGAIVFSINGDKCRASQAKVIDIEGADEAVSGYDPKFVYRKGKTIYPDDFDCRYNQECSSGIHFFRTREEAEKYY